jgi:hypothetical protein
VVTVRNRCAATEKETTMDASNLSLLFAVSAPVCSIAALHLWLKVKGERGTLLLPDRGAYEPTSCQACVLGAMVKAQARARAEENALRIAAANDGCEREAA